MPLLCAAPVPVTARERLQLEALVRQRTCPQQLVIRAQIILLADQGIGVRETAAQLRIGRTTVQGWRRRWAQNLNGNVAQRLSDAPRPGTPATFSAEQVCMIIALACESPHDSGRAITHWTQHEIADEAIKRGIVEGISPHSVGRFLKGGRPQTASEPLLAQRQAGHSVRAEVSGYLRNLPPGTGAGGVGNRDHLHR